MDAAVVGARQMASTISGSLSDDLLVAKVLVVGASAGQSRARRNVVGARLGLASCRLRGTTLKHYEDLLDAAVCAYLAYCAWYWGPESYQVYGDISTGTYLYP